MRARRFALLLLVLPVALEAQRMPRTGVSRPTTPQPAPLPPAAGPVARALTVQESRWSATPYSVFSSMRLPTSTFSTIGVGTQGSYRVTDHFATTVDAAVSVLGGPSNSETFEVGARYWPSRLDADVRPYLDARLGYLRMADYASSTPGAANVTTYTENAESASGLGGIVGTGFEYGVTNKIALSMGVSAVRSFMTVFASRATQIPAQSSYWMNTVRLTIGLRYTPLRSIQ